MAFPINLVEANATFLAKDRDPYPIWVHDYQLGQTPTIRAASLWQFSRKELDHLAETGIVFFRFVGGQPPMCVANADPTEFEGQNVNYVHVDCFDLPTFVRNIEFDGRATIDVTSAWQLNPEGLKQVLEQQYIVLWLVGGQCDCAVFARDGGPF